MRTYIRGKDEGLLVNGDISVTVVAIHGDEVLLAIDAPEWMEINAERSEETPAVTFAQGDNQANCSRARSVKLPIPVPVPFGPYRQVHTVTGRKSNRPSGIRTPDQGITSPPHHANSAGVLGCAFLHPNHPNCA